MSWWRRLRNLGPQSRRRMEEQLEKELRFHLEEHTADLIARGMEPLEARRRARLELGGTEQVKEQCREARGTRWLEDLGQDVRYSIRTLRQRQGFAAVALCTLGLGIGATTLMFSVVHGVLLKSLPYPEPDKLVTLEEKTEQANEYGDHWAFAYPNFIDCQRESRSLDMAAWSFGGGILSAPGEPEYLSGRQISAGLFSVLGVSLSQGRAFQPAEDRPGGAPVVIIGHSLWQRRFGARRAVLGTAIVFDGHPYTVVGVAPAGFQPASETDVFLPLGQAADPRLQNREAHFLRVVARIRRGATLSGARAELNLTGRHLAEQYPKSNAGRGVTVSPLRQDGVGEVQPMLWLLLGAVSVILLIACVNIASLLLARAASRERELALRMALGAGRRRLARQCLTESAVLALAGGVLGVLLAAWGVRPFLAMWPGTLPRAGEVRVDGGVLLFALAASLGSGLLFGLVPALRVPAQHLELRLRAAARTTAGGSRRLHSGFVICEIALAVVLLVAAGLLGRAMVRLSSLDPGVDIRNVLVARVALSPGALNSAARTRAAWRELIENGRRVPGARAIAVVDTFPMREGYNELSYWNSPALPPSSKMPLALATSATPDYLKVMGIPLYEGRFFDEHDSLDNEPVVVIDEVMARRAFGAKKAVGEHLWIPLMSKGPVRVVGVVGHVRHWGLANDDEAEVRDQFYYPFAQVPDQLMRFFSSLMSVAVRTEIPPLSVLEPLRREMRGAAGDQVLYQVRTMGQLASASLARQRFLSELFGVFAALALLLACTGIYGVLAYLTSQRVAEIGVRMALGATARDVVRLVLRQSLGMILAGVSGGLAAGLATARLLQRTVSGIGQVEPLTIAAMVAVLMIAALAASLPPARRVGRIDAIDALRHE